MMNAQPDFDFQLGKAIRLRGWGRSGLAALVLLLLAAITIGPTISAMPEGVLHLTSALKNLW